MTFSILAYDEKTGTYGGAAATGSLCVGGWVLRGGADSGLSASQGTAPSTLWGEESLVRMHGGETASAAVAAITGADPGRAHRQLAALDPAGGTGAFTGTASIRVCDTLEAPGLVVAGNMLASKAVLPAMVASYRETDGTLAARLLAALRAGDAAGSDSRGLLSAALLIVGPDMAPLSLRIDHDPAPLTALDQLYARSQADPYHAWTAVAPTLNDPHLSLPEDAEVAPIPATRP